MTVEVCAGDHVENALRAAGALHDNEVVTGWVLVYEVATLEDDGRQIGQVRAPATTDWLALGMLEFAWRWLIAGDEDD